MKVLHIITGLGAGGAERMLTGLLTGEVGRTVDHVVVSLTDAGIFGDELKRAGVHLHCLEMARGTVSLQALWKLRSLLRKEAPDIVQTWMYHADLAGLLATKAWSRATRLIWNVRCTAMVRGYHSVLTAAVIKALAKVSSIPDAVVVNSDRGLQDHRRLGYHPLRWIKIPNGFDVDRFKRDLTAGHHIREKLGIPADAVVFGMVARFDPMKNHAGFLEAASMLAEKYPKPHFLLAGDGVTGENELFADAMRNASLSGRIHCLGLRRDVPALMSAIDGLVLCSGFGEGFPNVVGEAMSCSVPCIVSDVGEAAEIVANTGCVIRQNDAFHIVEAMEQFLGLSDDQRLRLGGLARRRIQDSFAIEKVEKLYLDLYGEIAAMREAGQKPVVAKQGSDAND